MHCADPTPRVYEGILCCPCACPDERERVYPHRRERVYVGPETGEIVLHLHRNPKAGLYGNLNVSLKIRRNRCAPRDACGRPLPMAEATLKPYASEKAVYYFPIEGEFFTDPKKFPKGFYLGDVLIDDCVVDTIEIVKAPGVWTGEATSTTGKCFELKTFVDQVCPVEDCEDNPPPRGRKPCEPKVIIADHVVNEKYISSLDELFED